MLEFREKVAPYCDALIVAATTTVSDKQPITQSFGYGPYFTQLGLVSYVNDDILRELKHETTPQKTTA